MDDRDRRIILQHVRTARLLGVDSVPVRWRDDQAANAPAPVARPVPATPPTASASPLRAGSQIEPRAVPTPPAPLPTQPVPIQPLPLQPMPRARRTGTWAHTPIELPPGPRDAATNTALLQRVRERYDADRPHERFNTRHTNVVWGEGDPCAALMFVGEAPGENEDLTGRPFVGRAGELLTKMIGAMGLSRESVYIANIVKVRPPDNATPTIEEAEASAPYLFDQIRVIAPKVIVTLGLPSTRALLATGEAMRDLRGKFFDFPPPHARRTGAFAQFEDLPTIPVMPTYHPAYLLRSYTPENRQKAWSDLQQVMERLGLARPGPV